MSTTPSIPCIADELTAEWITTALRSTGAATGRAEAVEVTPVGVGIGLVADLARVTPRWLDGRGPATVIAKFPSSSAGSRFVASVLGMYRKEVHFYRELAERCPVPGAECYYADLDDETDDFILLLADLAGGRTVDQLDGCGLVDAEIAVDRLADLHACFWNDAALVDNGWLGRLCDPPFPAAIASSFEQAWGPVQDLFADRIPDAIVALGDRFPALVPALAARLSEDPCTLSHGDYRLDNMFFGGSGELTVYDWQLVDRSRGARDLAYFLTQSFTPETRAEAEEALIERYVAQLAAHGIEGYDLEVAWEDYRLATLFAFAYPVVAGGGLVHADARATELTGVILDRSIAAITDLGCLGLVE